MGKKFHSSLKMATRSHKMEFCNNLRSRTFRKRKGQRLLVQSFIFLTLGFFLYCFSPFLKANENDQKDLSDNRILAESTTTDGDDCAKIDPTWMVVFYIIGVMYCFLALAVVCDEYFVPTLEFIGDKLKLSKDVAGATLMAAGGSAPELFTSLFGTFRESAIGFGTIVGSATFNVFFVIAVCAVFSSEVLVLTWWPLARDCAYYTFGLTMLAVFFGATSPLEITWWEALLLLFFYAGYVLIMKYNEHLYEKVTNSKVADSSNQLDILDPKPSQSDDLENSVKRRGSMAGDAFNFSTFRMGLFKVLTTGDISVKDRAGMFVIAQIEGDVQKTFENLDTENRGYLDRAQLNDLFAKIKPKPTQKDVDETLKILDKNNDGFIDFEEFKEWYTKSEASMQDQAKVLFHKFDTNNNNLIEEDEFSALLQEMNMEFSQEKALLTFTKIDENGDGRISEDEFYKWFINEMFETHVRPKRLSEPAEAPCADEKEDEEEGFSFEPPVQDGAKAVIMWLLLVPLYAAFKISIPPFQDQKKHQTGLAVAAFIMSIGWLGFFSYFMVTWAEAIGKTAGIPMVVMGLTILAAGTSVPDLISSYIVARQGYGDMAVSSSIGSNIFDILVGLPFPWLLYTIAMNKNVQVDAENLILSIVVLLCMLVAVIISIRIYNWKMTKGLGVMMFVFYLIYVFQDLYRADWSDTC
mmetsp:Transcript_20648/g.27211  ORF Transcript_20648/g.27211 Transcript_20648/m.27211 type:complete len:693 (-) Transcript_20648:268-2346(-)